MEPRSVVSVWACRIQLGVSEFPPCEVASGGRVGTGPTTRQSCSTVTQHHTGLITLHIVSDNDSTISFSIHLADDIVSLMVTLLPVRRWPASREWCSSQTQTRLGKPASLVSQQDVQSPLVRLQLSDHSDDSSILDDSPPLPPSPLLLPVVLLPLLPPGLPLQLGPQLVPVPTEAGHQAVQAASTPTDPLQTQDTSGGSQPQVQRFSGQYQLTHQSSLCPIQSFRLFSNLFKGLSKKPSFIEFIQWN